jgi:hypothetical protein
VELGTGPYFLHQGGWCPVKALQEDTMATSEDDKDTQEFLPFEDPDEDGREFDEEGRALPYPAVLP